MERGYILLVWVNDKNGKEYVCTLDESVRGKSYEELTDKEREQCSDVNQNIGAELW